MDKLSTTLFEHDVDMWKTAEYIRGWKNTEKERFTPMWITYSIKILNLSFVFEIRKKKSNPKRKKEKNSYKENLTSGRNFLYTNLVCQRRQESN